MQSTPHEVCSKYLDIYGLDGVFPVANTEIGRSAAIASEEILYLEIAPALALRGAQVFVQCSSEIGSPNPTHKQIVRRARAIENLGYVVSANTAGISGTPMPLASADGNSAIIDWKDNVLAESNSGETFTAFSRSGVRRPPPREPQAGDDELSVASAPRVVRRLRRAGAACQLPYRRPRCGHSWSRPFQARAGTGNCSIERCRINLICVNVGARFARLTDTIRDAHRFPIAKRSSHGHS